MQSDKAYYLTVGVNDIPWERLVHWYGRATNFPGLFADIISDDKEKQQSAIDEIGCNIEHQDGIMMATPFTLIFLLRSLSFDTTDKATVLKKILKVVKAVQFQLEFHEWEPIDVKIESIKELLSEQYLWPAFESEDQDEINWEEDLIGEERYYWLTFTYDIVKAYLGILKALFTDKFCIETVRQIWLIVLPSEKYF